MQLLITPAWWYVCFHPTCIEKEFALLSLTVSNHNRLDFFPEQNVNCAYLYICFNHLLDRGEAQSPFENTVICYCPILSIRVRNQYINQKVQKHKSRHKISVCVSKMTDALHWFAQYNHERTLRKKQSSIWHFCDSIMEIL